MVSNSISAGQLEFPVKFETFNCRNGFLGVDYIYLVFSHDRIGYFQNRNKVRYQIYELFA